MREILFRGKSNWSYGNTKEGDWLYGMTISRHCYNDEEITSYYIGGGNKTIHAKTLGQYTGLTDKNDKKIFEGDILADNPDGSITNVFEIFWDEELAGFMLDDGLNLCCTNEWLKSNESNQILLEVIGNIYDNPELLKSQKEV